MRKLCCMGSVFWIRTHSVCGSGSIQYVDPDPFSVWIPIQTQVVIEQKLKEKFR
jgi:hypothetical protein